MFFDQLQITQIFGEEFELKVIHFKAKIFFSYHSPMTSFNLQNDIIKNWNSSGKFNLIEFSCLLSLIFFFLISLESCKRLSSVHRVQKHSINTPSLNFMLLRTVTLSLSLSHVVTMKANNLHVLFPCDRTIFYLPRNVETTGNFEGVINYNVG